MGLGLRISALNRAADAAAKIKSIFLNNWEHKILLYANKVLVFLISKSLNSRTNTISHSGKFSLWMVMLLKDNIIL